MSKTLNEYEKTARLLGATNWLGVLAYFKVTDSNVKHSVLESVLKKAKLDAFVPAAPRDDDVFRRVFFNGQRKGSIATGNPDITENLLVRQISCKDKQILKRIVVERVNQDGKHLDYTEAHEVLFVAHPDVLSQTIAPGSGFVSDTHITEHKEAQELATRLTLDYTTERGCLDANAVRMIIRRVLDTCKATPIRDGLYFVPNDHVDTIEQLERASEKIPGCFVHSLPLLDDDKQRNNLRAAFESEVSTDVDRLIAEIVEITKSDKEISDRRAIGIVNQVKAIDAKITEYRDVLSDSLEDAENRLNMLRIKLPDLLNCVKE